MRGAFNARRYNVGACLVGILGGIAVVVASKALPLVLAVAGVTCVYLLTKPAGRMAWFVLGALFVFQSGGGLTLIKFGYLAGVILSVALALLRLRTVISEPWGQRFRQAVIGAWVLVAWVALFTSIHSIAVRGISAEAWGRDALTHLLIGAAVLLGIDVAASVTVRQARLATMVVGAVAAFGFSAAWIARRNGDLAEQDLLASVVALTVPLALALALGLIGTGFRLSWLLYAAGLVTAVLVTGTRTGAVLGTVILGLVGARKKSRVPPLKAAGGLLAAAATVAVALPLFGDRFTAQGFREARWDAAVRVIRDGFEQDRSGIIRARAYEYAAQIANDFPLLGQGLGVPFPNPNPGGAAENFSLDTPWVYPAKFGVVGTVVIGVALALIIAACTRTLNGERFAELTAARGAVVVWVTLLPFGATTEDKGFALSVALLVMLIGAASKGDAEAAPGLPETEVDQHGAESGRKRCEVVAASVAPGRDSLASHGRHAAKTPAGLSSSRGRVRHSR